MRQQSRAVSHLRRTSRVATAPTRYCSTIGSGSEPRESRGSRGVAGADADGNEMRVLATKQERQEQTLRVVLLLASISVVETAAGRSERASDA
jgi:hypothetical protein